MARVILSGWLPKNLLNCVQSNRIFRHSITNCKLWLVQLFAEHGVIACNIQGRAAERAGVSQLDGEHDKTQDSSVDKRQGADCVASGASVHQPEISEQSSCSVRDQRSTSAEQDYGRVGQETLGHGQVVTPDWGAQTDGSSQYQGELRNIRNKGLVHSVRTIGTFIPICSPSIQQGTVLCHGTIAHIA